MNHVAHNKQNQLRELHLFAGAGGGILGGMLCGHRTVCAVEIEKYPREVLLQRQRDGILPEFPIWDDVRTFDGNPWRGKVDVVCGGFPCQDISCAGKGAGIEGERSGMWGEMARIIGEIRPKYAFVENSPMLVGRGLAVVIGDLAEMGYDANWAIVGAHHVSAPHRRDRIWILATDPNLCGCNHGSNSERQHETNHTQIWQAAKDQQPRSFWQHWTSENGGNVANSNLPHGERARQPIGSRKKHAEFDARCTWWGQDPAEIPESPVGRMANGVAARVDRLKAIGNGQVPQCVALAWRILTNTK
jgi:DNA (cytosine-5)-methyltransferase 1